MIKVLNLYAGIGGNRKLWKNVDVTAIENKPEIAAIYQDFFPEDKVIVEDAHQYLLDHYEEYDFIWSSPPCPSHSRARMWGWKNDDRVKNVYPDMKLYEEVIFLKHYCIGKWLVENVISYYDPLIEPQTLGRHYFWSNFLIAPLRHKRTDINRGNIKEWEHEIGLSLQGKIVGQRKDQILRNCTEPGLGKQILEYAINPIKTQGDLLNHKDKE